MTEKGPVKGWIREYRAKKITLDELATRIAGYDFPEQERYKNRPEDPFVNAEINDIMDSEEGTFDDVNDAWARGDLTAKEHSFILKKVWRHK